MDDQPLDLSKSAISSTTQSQHLSPENQQDSINGNKLALSAESDISHGAPFSTPIENRDSADEQYKMATLHLLQIIKGNGSQESRDVIPRSKDNMKRKMDQEPGIKFGAKCRIYFHTASNKNSEYMTRTTFPYCSEIVTPERATPRPSTSACESNSFNYLTSQGPSVNRNRLSSICNNYSRCFQLIKDNLERHKQRHTDEQSFVSNERKRALFTKDDLKKHCITHRAEKRFSCERCDKSYSTKYRLEVHIRSHANGPPFVCSECKKVFSCSSNLKRHFRIHTKERTYLCPTCGRAFSEESDMEKHKSTHKEKLKET